MAYRSSHRWCSVRKGVLRNFAKFTGKHLCQSLFFNKVAGLQNTFFTEHLQTTDSGHSLYWGKFIGNISLLDLKIICVYFPCNFQSSKKEDKAIVFLSILLKQ